MKITLDFRDEEEFEVFRDMLGHGMIEMVNRHDTETAYGYFKAKSVFEVYERIYEKLFYG